MSQHIVARDKKSKAVVSVDNHGLTEYKKARSMLRNKNKKIDEMEMRLKKLERLVSNLMDNKQ